MSGRKTAAGRKPSGARKAAGVRASRAAAERQAGPQRLQRLLAAAGFGSRRQCEELIADGRVEVDGEIVTQLGKTVDPSTSKVRVDGAILKKQKLVYYAVNKPDGVLSTNRDPEGRPRVVDLVPKSERVYPVGRLDRSSNGLMLLTNDGELAQQLAHPKFGVKKIYRVTVAGKVDGPTMGKMRKGMYIAGGFVRVEGARILKSRSRATELEIVLREGKNREIRRILARLGHKVQRLTRIAIGPLRLGDMPAGAHRPLTREEVRKLYASVEFSREEAENEGARRSGSKRSPRKSAGKSSAARSVKKSKTTRPKSKTPKFDFDGSSKSSSTRGAIIGGDTDDNPKKKTSPKNKRATKKRSTKKSAVNKRSTKKRSSKKRRRS